MTYTAPSSVSALEAEIEALENIQTSPKEVEEPQKDVVEEPLSKEEETFKKRYADLRRHQQAEKLELEARIRELEESSKGSNNIEISSVEEAKEWALNNPKAAAIIRALSQESAPKSSELNDVKKEVDKFKQEALIRKSHPDLDDVTSDPAFHDWAEAQPERVQEFIYGSDATNVIWALNLYKKETESRPDYNKEAARNVSKKKSTEPDHKAGMNKFSESQVNNMSLEEYEANEDAIRDAMKNGKFVYDLSGAAR